MGKRCQPPEKRTITGPQITKGFREERKQHKKGEGGEKKEDQLLGLEAVEVGEAHGGGSESRCGTEEMKKRGRGGRVGGGSGAQSDLNTCMWRRQSIRQSVEEENAQGKKERGIGREEFGKETWAL